MMKKYSVLLLTLTFVLGACDKKPTPEFDRKSLLESMYTLVIAPEHQQYATELQALYDDVLNFQSAPSLAKLNAMRTQYLVAYRSFQRIGMYNFGPAEDIGFKASTNTYPVNVTKINANIVSGEYSLDAVSNVDAIGFPAMDYLLFGATETVILNRYTLDANATNTMNYLVAVMAKLNGDFHYVHSTWTNTYSTNFKAADGIDIGSSISLIFNEMVKDLELLKNAKIGIPAGQFSGGELFPTYVEAYYSGYSKFLAVESIIALKNTFTGGTGIGLDDYMDFVEENQGISVNSSEIEAQFDVCLDKINNLAVPFSSDVSANTPNFEIAFQELKKLVAYAKTDISGALGVQINYSDTDGD